MALPRPQKPDDPLEGIRKHAYAFLDTQDKRRASRIENFKLDYRYFWPENWSKEDTQAQCDMLAETPAADPNGVLIPGVNMLQYTFQKTYEYYLFLSSQDSNAFADGRTDPQGRMSPGGVVYTEYLTPPWEFEYRQDGGITLLGDAQIDFNPPVEPVEE